MTKLVLAMNFATVEVPCARGYAGGGAQGPGTEKNGALQLDASNV